MNPLEERIAALAAKFAARAPEERDALAAAIEAGDESAVIDRAHKLGGIAGMFGHHSIGEAALGVEEAALAGGDWRPLAEDLLARLDAL